MDLHGGKERPKKLDVDRELNDIEVDALRRFKVNDKEIVTFCKGFRY